MGFDSTGVLLQQFAEIIRRVFSILELPTRILGFRGVGHTGDLAE